MVLETIYGDYTITGIRLRTILDTQITLRGKSITTFNQSQFYDITGAIRSSHGPIDKLNDMVRFGLLTKKDQTYTITELAKEFLESDGAERSKVVEKIIRQIPLWNKLLDAVGKNPSLSLFEGTVRQITQAKPEIIARNLQRLLNAYNGDVECIHKSPPYGKISALIGRSRTNKEPSKSSIQYEIGRVSSSVTAGSDKTPPNPDIKMSIEYGIHHVDIVDELSYRFAEQMLVVIKKELMNRGVRFGL
jgi:hypothetical protein